jgi:Fe-S-cluster containining protein
VGFTLPFRGTWAEVKAGLAGVVSGLDPDGHSRVLTHGGGEYPGDTTKYTHVTQGLPFEPLYETDRVDVEGKKMWRFWCPKLDRAGRCTIYADRPALCVAYQPKQDALCAEYVPPKPTGAEEPFLKKMVEK